MYIYIYTYICICISVCAVIYLYTQLHLTVSIYCCYLVSFHNDLHWCVALIEYMVRKSLWCRLIKICKVLSWNLESIKHVKDPWISNIGDDLQKLDPSLRVKWAGSHFARHLWFKNHPQVSWIQPSDRVCLVVFKCQFMLFQFSKTILCYFHWDLHWCVTFKYFIIDISQRCRLHMFSRIIPLNPIPRKPIKTPKITIIDKEFAERGPSMWVLGVNGHLGRQFGFWKMLNGKLNLPAGFCFHDVLSCRIDCEKTIAVRPGMLLDWIWLRIQNGRWQFVIIMSRMPNLCALYDAIYRE